MLENTYTRLPVIDRPPTSEQQPKFTAINTSSQPIPESSPYLTPMVQYFLEREAEWARG